MLTSELGHAFHNAGLATSVHLESRRISTEAEATDEIPRSRVVFRLRLSRQSMVARVGSKTTEERTPTLKLGGTRLFRFRP